MSDKPERIDEKSMRHLTNEQRVQKLQLIYDDALLWLESAAKDRNPKGTGAASLILRSSREEIVAWENKGLSTNRISISFDIPIDEKSTNE